MARIPKEIVRTEYIDGKRIIIRCLVDTALS